MSRLTLKSELTGKKKKKEKGRNGKENLPSFFFSRAKPSRVGIFHRATYIWQNTRIAPKARIGFSFFFVLAYSIDWMSSFKGGMDKNGAWCFFDNIRTFEDRIYLGTRSCEPKVQEVEWIHCHGGNSPRHGQRWIKKEREKERKTHPRTEAQDQNTMCRYVSEREEVLPITGLEANDIYVEWDDVPFFFLPARAQMRVRACPMSCSTSRALSLLYKWGQVYCTVG
jgi:hypothetical protein